MHPSPQGQPVTIVFARKGVLPPVYIASTFTDPPWEPVEMSFEADKAAGSTQFKFSTRFDNVHPGEHQYKFRIGPGDEGWTVDKEADLTVEGDHANNWMVVKSQQPPETLEQWFPAPTSVLPITDLATERTFAHEKLETTAAGNNTTTANTTAAGRVEPYGMQDARQLWLDDAHAKKAPESPETAGEHAKPAEADCIKTTMVPEAQSAAHQPEDVNIDVMSSRIAVALSDDVPSDLSTDLAMALSDHHRSTVNPHNPSAKLGSSAGRHDAGHEPGIEHIQGQLHTHKNRDQTSSRAQGEKHPMLNLAALLAVLAILWYLLQQIRALVSFA